MSDRATDRATDRSTDRATERSTDRQSGRVLVLGGGAEPLVPGPAVDLAPLTGATAEQRLPAPLAVPGAAVLRARPLPAARARLRRLTAVPHAGMSTAEYAVGMLAACGFAGLLLKVLTSSTVSGLLTGLVKRALTLVG
ncbi:MAG TPA: DUF4244 domain-containing protein [Motilibacteraceae bacterium]|nr:DUF4244 domain-containing protein [Motilibacteraceae bacterium]